MKVQLKVILNNELLKQVLQLDTLEYLKSIAEVMVGAKNWDLMTALSTVKMW